MLNIESTLHRVLSFTGFWLLIPFFFFFYFILPVCSHSQPGKDSSKRVKQQYKVQAEARIVHDKCFIHDGVW